MKIKPAGFAKKKKSLVSKAGVPLTIAARASLLGHLKHDRQAMAGLLEDYDPSLGNRSRFLRKMTGNTVISLVLGRCYW